MDDAESELRYMGVKDGEQELWAEQNGHMSWGKPRTNLKKCSVKEQEEGGEEEEKDDDDDDVQTSVKWNAGLCSMELVAMCVCCTYQT